MAGVNIRVAVGGYYRNLTLTPIDSETVKVSFGYNHELKEEVKSLEGARWNPEGKYWTIKRSQRNIFVLEFLQGKDPYGPYEKELLPYETKRPLYSHQLYDVRCAITRKKMLFAVDMGAGKSLVAIEALEHSGLKSEECIWVGPKNALRSVEMELLKWQSKVWPLLVTYDGLKKLIANWPKSKPAPKFIIFDEVQKIKTPTTQRGQAAKYLADNMRKEHDTDCYILGMSGTPAPKSPADWYWPCEVICPGYIKESNIFKFKARLGLVVEKDSLAGGKYPELVTWYDDEKKCKLCGKFANDLSHSGMELDNHNFVPAKNEVKILYERLKGLVVVQFKKDVLKELPEKIFRIIECKPTTEILRAAKLIVAKAKNVVSANVLLRELSDGFQYVDQEISSRICEVCLGKKKINRELFTKYKCDGCSFESKNNSEQCENCLKELYPKEITYESQEMVCDRCSGTGEVVITQREAVQITCPKEDVLIDVLEEHEDIGRLVSFAGFTGSVDRCVSIALKQKWNVIRVDSRGWQYFQHNETDKLRISETGLLSLFQDKNRRVEKCLFMGQADAAGLGLTLTESPSIFYYSNTFNAESRMQSMDRIHRPGMDINKGATIIDCIHLPSDRLVLDNLNKKQNLQSMSLGELKDAIG